MASLSGGQVNTIRSHPHAMKMGLVVQVPNTVLSAQVNDGSAARGDRVITMDNLSPPLGWQNVLSGMTLYVGTAQGARDKGRVRVRSATATTLTVAENSHIDWADDDWLTIGDIHEPWAIFPRVVPDEVAEDVDIYQDYDISYTDQNKKYPPVAIMGPPAVAFLISGTATVYFDGSDSYGLNAATISSYAWVFPSGTPGTSAVATPGNVSWSVAGHYVVRLTVTDSNGKTHTGYRWIRILAGWEAEDGFWPHTEFEVDSLVGSYSSGTWSARFTVRDQYGRLYPQYFYDNAQVILFGDGLAGDGNTIPICATYPYRQNLLFVGWVVGESVRKDPWTNDVTFDVEGICGRMAKIDSYPDTFEIPLDGGDPDRWYEAENPDLDLLMAAHLKWRSTIFEITDVFLTMTTGVPTGYGGTPWTTKHIMRQDFTHGSLYEQCDRLMRDAIGRMLNDKQGVIYCRIDPQVYPTPYRTLIPSVMTLSEEDYQDFEVERRTLDEVSQVDLSGVYHDGGIDPDVNAHPILSIAPGECPRYEGRIERVEGLIIEGQLNANVLSGDVLAWRNNPYPNIPMRMCGAYTFFDIIPEWVTWTLAAAATKRQIAWTAARFIAREVQITFDNPGGVCMVEVTWEKETDGEDGITGEYPPTEPPDPVPPEEPPDPPVDPPVPGPVTDGSWRKSVLACGSGGPYWTDNFVSDGGPGGVPDWTRKVGGMGADTNCVCLAFHPLEPENTHYVCTGNNVYRRQPVVSDNWVVILTAAQAAILAGRPGYSTVFYSIQTSPVYPGYIYALAVCSGGVFNVHTEILVSANLGASWSHLATIASGLGPHPSHLQIDQTLGTWMYVGITQRSALSGSEIWRSQDGGASWVNLGHGDVAIKRQPCISHYDRTKLYDFRSGTLNSAYSHDSGVTLNTVADQGGWTPKVYATQPGKHVYNSQRTLPGLVRCCDGNYIQKSLDHGVTWTRGTALGAFTGPWNIEVVPDAVDKLYLHQWGGGGTQVAATESEGGVCYDKDGVGGTAIGGDITDLTPIWTLP